MFKRTILITLSLVLIFTLTTIGADFRNVDWGMSKEEVKKIEESSKWPVKDYSQNSLTWYGMTHFHIFTSE